MRLDGRSILLTGATGGIGAAAAAACVRAGARVLLVARHGDRLEALARTLSAQPGHVAALAADVVRPLDRARIRDIAIARRVDTVVHNAATPCFGALDEIDEARIGEVLATNLVAPMQLTRLLLPWLRTLPRASVLAVGSTLGALGMPGYTVYSASKFGLRGFTESLRRELAGSTVAVQYLAPRTTRTAFNSARVDDYNAATGAHVDAPEDVARALRAHARARNARAAHGPPRGARRARERPRPAPARSGVPPPPRIARGRRAGPTPSVPAPEVPTMNTHTQRSVFLAAVLALGLGASALRAAPLDDAVVDLQREWATIKYQVPAQAAGDALRRTRREGAHGVEDLAGPRRGR